MNKYLLLGVIAVVLVAGCTAQSTNGGETISKDQGYGLEISQFEVDNTAVFSGKTIHPVVTIENMGQDTVSSDTGLLLLIAPNDWTITTGPDGTNANVEFKKGLEPANPATGAPADQQTYRWTIRAPDTSVIGIGQQRSDPIIGKIYYDYQTISRGTVFVYPESERFDEDKIISEFTATKGPVTIDVSILPDPPIIELEGETFTLQILLTNIGGGTPYSYGEVTYDSYAVTEDMRNNITVELTGIGMPGGSEDLALLEDDCLDDIELVNGKATVLCDINVTEVPSTKKPYSIAVTAMYGYTSEEQIEVTISGR